MLPVCSSPGTEPGHREGLHTSWAPAPAQAGAEERWADSPVAEPTLLLWLVKSGPSTLTAEQRLVGTSPVKTEKHPEVNLAPCGHSSFHSSYSPTVHKGRRKLENHLPHCDSSFMYRRG